jgi:hypothetical protein
MNKGGCGEGFQPIALIAIRMATSRHHVHPPLLLQLQEGRPHSHVLFRKGADLRICGFGMTGQGFYSIQVPEDEDNDKEKAFPRILTVKEGVANEVAIDAELKHLFKGRFG